MIDAVVSFRARISPSQRIVITYSGQTLVKSVLSESVLDFLLENRFIRTPSEGRHFLSMGLVCRKDGRDWKRVMASEAQMKPGWWRVWRRGYVKIGENGQIESISMTMKKPPSVRRIDPRVLTNVG